MAKSRIPNAGRRHAAEDQTDDNAPEAEDDEEDTMAEGTAPDENDDDDTMAEDDEPDGDEGGDEKTPPSARRAGKKSAKAPAINAATAQKPPR